MAQNLRRISMIACIVLVGACGQADSAASRPSSEQTESLSLSAVLKTARLAIQLETTSPLSAEELAAMAFVESSFNPSAIGDHGSAVGIMQFHRGTFYDYAPKDWRREDALQSMRVAIRYAKRGCRLWKFMGKVPTVPRLWSHHNRGNARGYNAEYASRCADALRRIRNGEIR